MRLKGIELQGFKSFADKTTLTFAANRRWNEANNETVDVDEVTAALNPSQDEMQAARAGGIHLADVFGGCDDLGGGGKIRPGQVFHQFFQLGLGVLEQMNTGRPSTSTLIGVWPPTR